MMQLNVVMYVCVFIHTTLININKLFDNQDTYTNERAIVWMKLLMAETLQIFVGCRYTSCE